MANSKLFLGPRLRRLRRDRGLSQTDMAASLAISPSYLNHLERNQRPVTAALLLRLAETYEIDVRAFAAAGGARTGPDDLAEIFSDALLSDLGVPRYELAEIAMNAPSVADAIARLYGALKEVDRNPSLAQNGDARALVTPENWVRDYIQQHRNHFPELEQCAETLGGALADPLSVTEPLRRRLKEAWGITARVVAPAELGNASQAYDPERRLFLLSSLLRAENRTFGARLPIEPGRIRRGDRAHGRGRGAARRRDPPSAPHEPCQLCRRRGDDALWPLPRLGAAASLFDRPAVRRIWRQCRTDRAPPDHARPQRARAASPSSC